jgi:2-hydroxy-3-keto-5-methylthiopentenyl-1-phosphate phosphatase
LVTFFIDFDGTITKQDTCNAVTKQFALGDWEALNEMWKERKLSTEECARQTFRMFDSDEESVKTFLYDNIELDDYFIPFLNRCRKNGHDLYVLSDGYDFNINTVFRKYGIRNIPYFSNMLIIKGRSFDIDCPHSSSLCKWCGVCKTEILQKLRSKHGTAVYIGDGYSDRCPAEKCDVIFAKDHLLDYCKKNHIPARPFTNFQDILFWLDSL